MSYVKRWEPLKNYLASLDESERADAIKEKIAQQQIDTLKQDTDFSKLSREAIEKKLENYTEFTIDTFTIKCFYFGTSFAGGKYSNITLTIYEKHENRLYKVRVNKDDRFKKFRTNVNQYDTSFSNINMDTTLDILVWCQKVNKYKLFI